MSNTQHEFKFGFIYTKYLPSHGLIFQGDQSSLRYCADLKQAQSFWSYNKDQVRHNMVIKIYRSKFTIRLPYLAEKNDNIIDITAQFTDYIGWLASNRGVEDSVFKFWTKNVLGSFDVCCDKNNANLIYFIPKLEENKLDILPDAGLYYMKQFIDGYFRTSPIKISVNGKRVRSADQATMDVHIGGDYNGEDPDYPRIRYRLGEVTGETPIYGLYVPTVINGMFGDESELGRVLQKWQMRVQMDLGRVNYIAASRGLGKSWLCVLLAGLGMMREPITRGERMKPILVNYFGQTDSDNETFIRYIMKLPELLGWNGVFIFDRKTNSLKFMSGDKVLGVVAFMSQLSVSKGRGKRPSMVIIDEAAFAPEEVFKIAYSNALRDETQIICISTIDPDTDRNWFYQGLVEAEARQIAYKSSDEMTLELWKKYKMDDVDTVDQLDFDVIHKMKQEMRNSRPIVGMRFTVEDYELRDEEEREQNMSIADGQSLDWILAEFYSILRTKSGIFNLEGTILPEDKIPQTFEDIVIGFDYAEDHDNPAAVVIGVKGKKAYIIHSEIVQQDFSDFAGYLNGLKNYYSSIVEGSGDVYLCLDTTQAKGAILDMFEIRGCYIDFPMAFTSGTDEKKAPGNSRITLVGKQLLVKIARELFDNKYINISKELDVKKGLIEEMSLFGIKDKGSRKSYEALKGKDDQVCAMLIALYYMYEKLGMKYVQNDSQEAISVASGNFWEDDHTFNLEAIEKLQSNKLSEADYSIAYRVIKF